MRLFRRKPTTANAKQEELAATIAGRIIGLQTRAADYLNVKTAHLSPQIKLFILILFCTLFATINIYLLIHSI